MNHPPNQLTPPSGSPCKTIYVPCMFLMKSWHAVKHTNTHTYIHNFVYNCNIVAQGLFMPRLQYKYVCRHELYVLTYCRAMLFFWFSTYEWENNISPPFYLDLFHPFQTHLVFSKHTCFLNARQKIYKCRVLPTHFQKKKKIVELFCVYTNFQGILYHVNFNKQWISKVTTLNIMIYNTVLIMCFLIQCWLIYD